MSDKVKKNEIRFVVSDQMYEKVNGWADEYGETVGSFVRHILIRYLVTHEKIDAQNSAPSIQKLLNYVTNNHTQLMSSEEFLEVQKAFPAVLKLVEATKKNTAKL
ncbi:MAG: hypothetical protein D3924_01625 [Candidatus Electrothrix sp. AR4]|nr:hypothetical protein [Candidatus Electrothrix sp. AR4]